LGNLNYYSVVPREFIARPTATTFSTELTRINPSGDTVEIPFSFIVDRDYFGSSFPSWNDILLTLVNSQQCTINGHLNKIYTLNNSEVTESTDAVYGPVLIISDIIEFTYSSLLPLGPKNCTITILLEPDGRHWHQNTFFKLSVVNVEGMIELLHIYKSDVDIILQ